MNRRVREVDYGMDGGSIYVIIIIIIIIMMV